MGLGAYPDTDAQMGDIQLAEAAAKALKEKYDKPFFMSVGFFRPACSAIGSTQMVRAV